MASTIGAPAELDMPAALEDAVEDGFGEIRVVEHPAQAASGLLVVKIIGRWWR